MFEHKLQFLLGTSATTDLGGLHVREEGPVQSPEVQP